jgi:phosphatidylserine decarboxylase
MAIMLFFRDPDRETPDGDKLIVSPADGRIIKIDDLDGYPLVSIFLSIFNVHVNRAPVSGKIISAQFRPGRFFSAFKDRAMKENQKNDIEFETPSGIVKMSQVTGSVARRIIFYNKIGDELKAGQRVGLIRFGSRVDLILPPGSNLDIVMKQKVVGGKTVLGRLP